MALFGPCGVVTNAVPGHPDNLRHRTHVSDTHLWSTKAPLLCTNLHHRAELRTSLRLSPSLTACGISSGRAGAQGHRIPRAESAPPTRASEAWIITARRPTRPTRRVWIEATSVTVLPGGGDFGKTSVPPCGRAMCTTRHPGTILIIGRKNRVPSRKCEYTRPSKVSRWLFASINHGMTSLSGWYEG